MTAADTTPAATGSAPSAPSAPAASSRLVSLDALRGFDMFWIVGGREIFIAWAAATGWPWLHWIVEQCEHVEWHGFRFWDLVFPLFLFVAGVAMPFSLTRRLERGADRAALRRHVTRRALLLVLVGFVYNGLLTFDFDTMRYPSVLGRIGLGFLGAAWIVLHTRPRAQLAWAVGILLGYWVAMSWIPVPGHGAGDLTPGHTLAGWIDRHLVPGRLHRGDHDPEGLFSTIPAVATALLGALAGHVLRARHESGRSAAAPLFGAGLACALLGAAWDVVFPINKTLWTSSFVVWTAGLSLMLLAVFHQVIDVWRWRRWAFFFVVIGANALLVYVARRFVDFDGVAAVLLARADGRLHPALLAAGGLALEWLLLYLLWRRRIFVRL